MPLPRIHFDQTNRPLHTLVPWADKFEFDTPYQRGLVWDDERKRNLIKSLMQALPIGVLFLNHRAYTDTRVYVVDGKQRLNAILDFTRDGFTVPARWFADETTEADGSREQSLLPEFRDELDADIVFSQLTDLGQGRFMRNLIACYETQLPTVDAERELFDRINFGGIPVEAQ